ncbi:hypothetical protein C8R45DRAFT_1209505 [Mycena sanguinolenta]|nr:hypothetical protein C8R45DRAFT_1209505 [Mycena sanguinolenta]
MLCNGPRTATKKRNKLFAEAGVACLTNVQTARVSTLRPLIPGQWALVAADFEGQNKHGIYLAQVITLYARGAGVNGKHGLVVDGGKPNINAFSYIGVQLYELDSRPGAFSPVTQQTVHLQTSTFAHLPAIQVLAVVRNPRMTQKFAILSDEDFSLFSKLRATRGNVSTAIKNSRKRKESMEEDL